jgi:hypothetical protein
MPSAPYHLRPPARQLSTAARKPRNSAPAPSCTLAARGSPDDPGVAAQAQNPENPAGKTGDSATAGRRPSEGAGGRGDVGVQALESPSLRLPARRNRDITLLNHGSYPSHAIASVHKAIARLA